MNKQSIENFTYGELFDFHGYEVDYYINNFKGKGKISVDRVQDKIYICQNTYDGVNIENKLNFKYSYILSTSSINNNYWKNCIENIYLPEKTFSKEELLEEAKRKYPIGTVIKLSNGNITEIKKNIYFDTSGDNIIWNDGYGKIYDNGKWAEIVSKPEEKIENLYPKKYSLGKIKFKNIKAGDVLPYYYYTEYDGIPEELIVHGNTKLHESYKYAEIVNYYKEFYLVKYLGDNNKYVTLGFEEESLEPYVEEVKENSKVEEKPQFEVGKWYKCDCNKNFYRFKEVKGNKFVNDAVINPTQTQHGSEKPGYTERLREHTLLVYFKPNNILTDLSEIQQYLPEGHPDKIKTVENKIKEWSANTYLVIIKEGYCGYNQTLKHLPKLHIGLIGEILYDYNDSTTAIKENPVGNWIFEKELAKWFETKKEAEEFAKTLTKPVKNKSLVGRYLKALVDEPNGTPYKKGDYIRIENDDLKGSVYCEKAMRFGWKSYEWEKSKVELMPEGFEPEKQIDLEKIKNQIIEKYPVGTKFKDLVHNEIFTVKNHNFDTFGKENQLYISVESNLLGNKTARIWKDNIFAEKVKKEEEIPEYVECVNEAGWKPTLKKGVIYDTKAEIKGTTTTWKNRLSFCPSDFKPSSKEAYDRQQPIKKQWIPKVGDWVVSLVDREGYRKKGDVFQVLEVSGDCIYYTITTNGYINTFRPAEPHEIPKKNGVDPIEETKPKIDSWCIQVTEENKELLLQNKHVFKADWSFDNLKHYYGIDKFNVPSYYTDITHFDKVLTTEEFCKKFSIVQNAKYDNKENNKTEELMYKTKTIKTFNRNF